MTNTWGVLDPLLFGVLPYVALFTFFLVTIQRYRARTYSYSSLSSQFLENRQHFWGLVPFHYGILVVLTGHVLGFLIPRQILLWNSVPLRLYFLEVTGLAFALMALVGLAAAMVRRASVSKVLRVTTRRDWFLLRAAAAPDRYRHRRGGVPPLGLILVLHRRLALPVVHRHPQPAGRLAGRAALAGEAAHRQRLAADRFLPLHAAGARAGGPQPVPLAQAAGGSLVPAARRAL